MGQIKFDDFIQDKINTILEKVETNSSVLNDVVNSIINPYCKELDNYISFIQSVLADGENPPTNEELDDFCLNLSTLIYFAGSMCEQLGIKDDISRAIYKEVYNRYRSESAGTVVDKNTAAETLSQQEQLTNICYNRAYKIMKSKVENAQELLGSCKKVVSRRMSEFELTHMQR